MRGSCSIILGFAVISAFACGGGSSKSNTPLPTPSPVSDEAFKTAATAAVESVQITQADLPAGWTGKSHQINDTKLDLSPACAFFNEADPWRSAVANVNSDDFADPADREVNSQAVAYRSVELANADASMANKIVTSCGQEISDAIEASIVKDTPGITADATFTRLTTAELGGWTAGYTLSISAASAGGDNSVTISGAWVWRLSGRMVVAFEYSASEATPVDPGMLTALKSLLATRLDAADATLPN